VGKKGNGVQYITTKETLTQVHDSMLAAMFSGRFPLHLDSDGSVFIDRDGTRFRHVLNWLRTGTLPSFDCTWRYEEVLEEADFFALGDLAELVRNKIEESEEMELARRTAEEQNHKSRSVHVMVIGKGQAAPATPNTIARVTQQLGIHSSPGAAGAPPGSLSFSLEEDF